MSEAPNQADGSIREEVEQLINRNIRPALQGDGGDIELLNVSDDGVVTVRLQGACAGCPSAGMTLKMGVERFLKDKIPGVKEVVTG